MNNLERRRTERILAPIRIRVIGNDMSGAAFAEETVTVTFNQQGARISLVHSLLSDDIVLLKNLDNDMEGQFRVVGAFQHVFGSRHEWGVEALNKENGIWGVEFAANDDSGRPKVLVECAACRNASQITLSSIEYEVLLATGLVSRHCDQCNQTTRWQPGGQTLREDIRARSGQSVVPGVEKRRTRRLHLIMRLRVRNDLGLVDIAQTRDVSKGGLCFISTQRFSVGDKVYLTLPDSKHRAPAETKGKVVWETKSTSGRIFGVEYLHSPD